MTLNEWGKRDDYIDLWSKTWQEPHMQAGLSVLIQLGLPQATPLMPAPASNESINIRAMAHSRTEGWYAALRSIDILKSPSGGKQDLPGPWEDVKRPTIG